MPTPLAFSRTIPSDSELGRWGLGVTAAGAAWYGPGENNPPREKSGTHLFPWESGRCLEAFQLLLLTSGSGYFETRETGLLRLNAGDAFMVFPGVWHRYAPEAVVGWQELWVEFKGLIPEHLQRTGLLDPRQPVRAKALAQGLEGVMEDLHQCARTQAKGWEARARTLLLEALGIWHQTGQGAPVLGRVERAVFEAQRQLLERLSEPVCMPGLSRRLGLAYSYFRREFKRRTGYSPWQWLLHQRLVRARRLLCGSDLTLEAVAGQLGFSSAFHLSAAFKQRYGVSPDRWRRHCLRSSEGT